MNCDRPEALIMSQGIQTREYSRVMGLYTRRQMAIMMAMDLVMPGSSLSTATVGICWRPGHIGFT